MTENEWTASICKRVEKDVRGIGLSADTLIKVPYSQEILQYDSEWNPEYMEPTKFETDLVIFEKNDGMIVPRVIVEAKLGRISTHDAITYSYKADKHKDITPFLRYGIMIGNRGDSPLPGRLFRHGENFDFMFSFKATKPSKEEWESFIEMILKEVEYSRIMEEMLHNSRNKNRKRYYMMQKQLILKEM